MVQVIQAQTLNIIDLEQKFGLTQADDDQFFSEWYENLTEISDLEKQVLDRVKSNYLSLVKHREISENMVKLVVLGPLLTWTDFYHLPFDVVDEQSMEVTVQDQDELVRGRLDIMVLKDHLWLLVIESKNAGLSLLNGIPQALVYMAANPHPDQTVFGLVTNGSELVFIKLVQQNTPKYALSEPFSLLKRDNELYTVLSILKKLSQLMIDQ
ncbi:MAG: type I restriction endonuclease [Coleofasciculus sp. D1-CHI-01]|uniref:type I restriction endonuclease n=1 Tax=Coleofasciculus sp. D1-CHI-01 TaxID=3068482 RepID=UPI0032FE8873